MKNSLRIVGTILILAMGLIGCARTPSPTLTAAPPSITALLPTNTLLSPSQTPSPGLTLTPSSPFPDTNPPWLQDLVSEYTYIYQVDNVRVFSDISADFSSQHAEHLKLVWDFFNTLYTANRGEWLDVYYTTNTAIFQKVIPYCPTILIPGARNLTACYLDYPRWFILPYQIPDFGTQLHEIGHDFLYATWPQSEDFPWFKEGTAMYFEGSVFTPDGSLEVPEPHAYCTSLFQKYNQQANLIPLNELVFLPKEAFLADAERAYSQSCMVFNYLQNQESGVLYGLIEGINSGAITSNDQLIELLLLLTGKSMEQIEESYEAYARQFSH